MKKWQKYLLIALVAYLIIKIPVAMAHAARNGIGAGGDALDSVGIFITTLFGG